MSLSWFVNFSDVLTLTQVFRLSSLIKTFHRYLCMKFSRYAFRKSKDLRNGDEEIRTLDPLLARQVLSQLSYVPVFICRPFSRWA